jgi:hypothetical protein
MNDKKEKYKQNPLAAKYGHQVHKKEKSGANNLRKNLRDASRSLRKALASGSVTSVIKRDLENKVKALQERIVHAEETKKEEALLERYKYVKFVGTFLF